MPDQELDHLIKMINQISSNVARNSDEEQVRNIATHVEKFWAPSMRNKISAHAESTPEDLQAAALQALNLLKA